jgi:hypothetical protein
VFYLSRAAIKPPEELLQRVFPFLDDWYYRLHYWNLLTNGKRLKVFHWLNTIDVSI